MKYFLAFLALLIMPNLFAQSGCSNNMSSDIGLEVMNKINALGGTCGVIQIPTGTYYLYTEIQKPRCVVLDFQNSVVNSCIAAQSQPGPRNAAIATGVANPTTDPNSFIYGGIKNLKLVGPGQVANSVGIWLGGDSAAKNPQILADFLSTVENVNVQNFETGIERGFANQMTFISDAVTDNKYGWQDSGEQGGENMQMYGFQFLNNIGYGLYAPNIPAVEYNCTSCSFDYNEIGAMYVMNGAVTIIGGHMEQCSGYFIDGPVTTGPAMNLTIIGTTFSFQGTQNSTNGCSSPSGGDPAYIHVTGYNSNVKIGDGVQLGRTHAVTSFINWAATGQSSYLSVQPYMDSTSNPALQTLAPGQVGAIASARIPLYGQYVATTQYLQNITLGQTVGGGFPAAGSIFTTGLIGSNQNANGSIPLISSFPYGGGYIGWNGQDAGEVDFYNPTPLTATTNDAYAFYLNNGNSFSKVASIDREGDIQATSAVFSKGYISVGVPGAASTWFSFASAPSGGCTAGDIGSNRSGGVGTSLYVCEGGTWHGK